MYSKLLIVPVRAVLIRAARAQRDGPTLTSKAREDEGTRTPREAEVVERWCSLTPTRVALYKTPEAICKKEKKKKERPDPSLQAHGCADVSVRSQSR